MSASAAALLAALAQVAAPPASTPTAAAASSVSPVPVTASAPRRQSLPAWVGRIELRDWPYFGVSEDGQSLLFARTAEPSTGNVQAVEVRREFREPRTDDVVASAGAPPPAKSERMEGEVDCTAGRIRTLRVARFPQNNLGGKETDYRFADAAWAPPQADTFERTVVDAACRRAGGG